MISLMASSFPSGGRSGSPYGVPKGPRLAAIDGIGINGVETSFAIMTEKNCLLVSDASSCPKEAEPIRQTFFSQEVSELNHEIGVKRFGFVMGDHEHGFSFRNRLFEIGENDLFAFHVQM